MNTAELSGITEEGYVTEQTPTKSPRGQYESTYDKALKVEDWIISESKSKVRKVELEE